MRTRRNRVRKSVVAEAGTDDAYARGRPMLGCRIGAVIGSAIAIDIAVIGDLPVLIVEQELPAVIAGVRHVENRAGIDFVVRGRQGSRLLRRSLARYDHIAADPERTRAKAKA